MPIRRKIATFCFLGAAQFVFLFAIHLSGDPSHYYGLEGAGAALFGVVAGIIGGTAAGLGVAAVGVVAYFAFLTDSGQTMASAAVILSALLWLLAALAAGVGAGVVRDRAARREEALSRALRDAEAGRRGIDRIATLAPAFHRVTDSSELPRAICEAALSTFEADSSALYRVYENRLVLLHGIPITELHRPGRVYSSEDLPGIVNASESEGPVFEPGLLSQELGSTGQPLILSLGIQSGFLIPVNLASSSRYVLAVGWREPRLEASLESIALARRFSDQVAVAIDGVEVEELHRRLEEGLLPRLRGPYPNVEVQVRYRPGEQRLGVGGDFVDVMSRPGGRFDFVIGDVTGRGPHPAALGSALRSSWRALTLSGLELDRMLPSLQQVLLSERRDDRLFATLQAGSVDTERSRLRLVSAAHPPPMLITTEGADFVQVRPSWPLGLQPEDEPAYPDMMPLSPGWTLLFYTDGLFEGMAYPTATERLWPDGLLEITRQLAGEAAAWEAGNAAVPGAGGPEVPLAGGAARLEEDRAALHAEDGATLLDRIIARVEAANGKRLPDDVAALMIRAGLHGTST